jgi:hypothetical protein
MTSSRLIGVFKAYSGTKSTKKSNIHDAHYFQGFNVGRVRIKLVYNNFLSLALEECLSITTGRCDLAIATHARKMHKKYQYDCQLEYFS